jgi:cytoskeleton protein RodZ
VRDNSGKLIFTRIGTKGSANSVKGKPPLSVMVKHANNVKLEFNGQSVDLKDHTSRDGIARLTLQ